MNILKINNDCGVYYLIRKDPFDFYKLIQQFTSDLKTKVEIECGLFITAKSEIFVQYLIEYHGFQKIPIDRITTVSMRKRFDK